MIKKIYVGVALTVCFIALGVALPIGAVDEKPLISVVMPTYNREDLLPRSIESILNQTVKDFEFVIVDDGSTDDSVKLIQSYQAKDKRIRLVRNPKNCGIACARNRGMDEAKGKYLAIMDSDDYSEPNRLEKSLAFFKKHPDYIAVNSVYYEMGREAKGVNNWVPPRRWEIIYHFANYYTNLAMFDLEFARKNGIRYDETLISAEDYDFWSRLWLAGGKLGMINEPLLRLRRHTSYPKKYYETIMEMRKVISARLLERFGISKEEAYQGNRCYLMDKMIKANEKKRIVNQYALILTYKKQCTNELLPAGSLYIKHFDFIDNFFWVDEKRYVRAENQDEYQLVEQTNEVLVLKNPKGKNETYHRQTDGSWGLVEDLN